VKAPRLTATSRKATAFRTGRGMVQFMVRA